jgi:hypothetical protein
MSILALEFMTKRNNIPGNHIAALITQNKNADQCLTFMI